MKFSVVNQLKPAEQKKESAEVLEALEKERLYVYQASIVRYVPMSPRFIRGNFWLSQCSLAIRLMKARKVRMIACYRARRPANESLVCRP